MHPRNCWKYVSPPCLHSLCSRIINMRKFCARDRKVKWAGRFAIVAVVITCFFSSVTSWNMTASVKFRQLKYIVSEYRWPKFFSYYISLFVFFHNITAWYYADFNEVTPIHVGYSLVKAETKSKIYITQLDFFTSLFANLVITTELMTQKRFSFITWVNLFYMYRILTNSSCNVTIHSAMLVFATLATFRQKNFMFVGIKQSLTFLQLSY